MIRTIRKSTEQHKLTGDSRLGFLSKFRKPGHDAGDNVLIQKQNGALAAFELYHTKI